jgi:hypothetical protein
MNASSGSGLCPIRIVRVIARQGYHSRQYRCTWPEAPDGGLQFGVSHSAQMALYAIGRSPELGVDVERIRLAVSGKLLSSGVLTIEDVAKAPGLGVALLDRADTPGPEWTLEEIPLGAGWKAALAVAGVIRDVRYWTLDAAVSGR